MAARQIENLLRENVEYYQCALAFGMAVFCINAGISGLTIFPAAVVLSIFFLGYGFYCLHAARRLARYHKGLYQNPPYSMRMNDIPVSKDWVFLGRGFEWRAKHVQRYQHCREPENEGFIDPPKSYQAVRWMADRLSQNEQLPWLVELLNTESTRNPFRPNHDLGGSQLIHGVGLFENEQDMFMPRSARLRHTVVEGASGKGKTRFLEILVWQDILKTPHSPVIVIDPKGDYEALMNMYFACKKAGRLDNFYVFHLEYPEYSARYSPVGTFTRVTEPATRVANNLPDQGQAAAFKEFVWRFVAIITMALIQLDIKPDYKIIAQYYRNVDALFVKYVTLYLERNNYKNGSWKGTIKGRIESIIAEHKDFVPKEDQGRAKDAIAFRELVETIKSKGDLDALFEGDQLAVLEGLISIIKYDKTHFDKLVVGLEPLMIKLTSGKIADILSPDYFDLTDPRPTFDIRQIIRQNGVLYIGLGALTDPTVASAVGSSFYADATSAAGEFYAHGTEYGLPEIAKKELKVGEKITYLHADEFSDLIGPECISMFNKGRGAGIANTIYTQTFADIVAGLKGNEARAMQTFGNLDNRAIFGVNDERTAKEFCAGYEQVKYVSVSPITSAQDNTDPTSSTQFTSGNIERQEKERVDFISPEMLTRLPIGQCFIKQDGGRLRKVRLPAPKRNIDDVDDMNIKSLLEKMQATPPQAQIEGWTHDRWFDDTVLPQLRSAFSDTATPTKRKSVQDDNLTGILTNLEHDAETELTDTLL